MRIFVAGAARAIGRQLVPLLVGAGHEVTGTTRSAERAAWLREAGATPVVLDAFDAGAVRAAISEARPEVVVNQLTDLSRGFGPEELVKTGRIRAAGTQNLVDAAVAAGARRMIAQSGAWRYAEGPTPHVEDHPLRTPTDAPADASLRGIIVLERLVTGTDGLEGVILRYGFFYGSHTAYPARDDAPTPRVSVESAAGATALAVDHGPPGVYNVVEDDPQVSNARARELLGWTP